jgi:hypothetical protein
VLRGAFGRLQARRGAAATPQPLSSTLLDPPPPHAPPGPAGVLRALVVCDAGRPRADGHLQACLRGCAAAPGTGRHASSLQAGRLALCPCSHRGALSPSLVLTLKKSHLLPPTPPGPHPAPHPQTPSPSPRPRRRRRRTRSLARRARREWAAPLGRLRGPAEQHAPWQWGAPRPHDQGTLRPHICPADP